LGFCAYCGKFRSLRRSHAIPNAAFKEIFRSSGGQGIAVPAGDGNVHKTSESGAAFLLCDEDEGLFNRKFDGPLINALKRLDNEIQRSGGNSKIEFPADHAAHAIVSIAWRICASPANMYSLVKLKPHNQSEIDGIFRSQSSDVLKYCTVRLGQLYDGSKAGSEGFDRKALGQFIVSPRAYSIKVKSNGKTDRFAIDWTMFGFLFHVVVPRIPYPRSKNFGGLKRDSEWIDATPVDLFEYQPILDVLVAGYAKNAEGKLSPNLKRRQ
jgi:hypothetical protein